VGARQVAETDLEGRSTGRSDTSFAAADARYGRGRPCDARGACWGARRTPRDFFTGEKRWSVDAMTTRGGPGKPASYFYTDDVSIVVYSNSVLIGNSDFADSTSFSLSALGPKSSSVDLSGWRYR